MSSLLVSITNSRSILFLRSYRHSLINKQTSEVARERYAFRADAMKALAIKKGRMQEQAPLKEPTQIGILRCDGCGEEFIIYHAARFMDQVALAVSRAHRCR